MTAVCLYFHVHQPYRLRPGFDYFAIGTGQSFEDHATNRTIMEKVARNCYLPATAALLEMIKEAKGRFKVAFSISGMALDQFEQYAPEVLLSFQALVATGCVELVAETYYHSLAYLYSEKEFRLQVKQHQERLHTLFGATPKTLRNTELIYDNHFGQLAESLGFKAVLAEGVDRVLDWRSPNFVYRPPGTKRIGLLLKNYRLSDDIAFRFGDRSWNEWPLTADRYVGWLRQAGGDGQVVNLFMDFETFGEHQGQGSGIFEFLRQIPTLLLGDPASSFVTPSEAVKLLKPTAELDVPFITSWADTERDASAWVGNNMQKSAVAKIYEMERDVKALQDPAMEHAWRKLQTSDHFYYMCTKHWQDGDVHKYFSPYASPYDAFMHYANALNEFKILCAAAKKGKGSVGSSGRKKSPRKVVADDEAPAVPQSQLVAAKPAGLRAVAFEHGNK